MVEIGDDGGDGDEEEDAREFDGGGGVEGFGAVCSSGSGNAGDIVDGDSGPDSELMLGEAESVSEDGEEDEGDSVQDEYSADGDGDIFFGCIDDAGDCGDGGSAADGGSGADKETGDGSDIESFGDDIPEEEDGSDTGEAKEDSA